MKKITLAQCEYMPLNGVRFKDSTFLAGMCDLLNTLKKCVILSFLILMLFQYTSLDAFAFDATVKVGVYNNKPLLFMDSDGKAKGVFVDILEHVASKEGWQLEFVPGTWQQCLSRLENKQIDILGAIAFSRDRDRRYDFGKEHVLTSWGQIFVPDGSKIHQITDVAGKKVAVLKGDAHYEAFLGAIEQFGVECEIIKTDDYQSILGLVSRRKVDAGVVNRFFGMRFGSRFHVEKSGVIFNPIKLYYAVPEGTNSEILKTMDRSVAALKRDENSAYYKSLQRWFEAVSGKRSFPVWGKWTIAVTLGLAIFFFLGTIILRNRVRAKTAHLNSELDHHRRTRETLQKSEEKYRFLITGIQAAIILHDSDKRIIICNPKAEELLGVTEDELLGKTAKDLDWNFLNKDGEVVPVEEYPVNLVMSAGKPLRGYRGCINRAKKNDQVWVLVHGDPMFDGAGNINQVIITFHDISQLIHMEEQLRAKNRELQLIFDTLPIMMFYIDRDGKNIMANKKLSLALGKPKEEIEGKYQHELFPEEQARNMIRDNQEVMQSGEVKARIVEPYQAADGTRWTRTTKAPLIDERNEIIGVVGFVEDITEQRRAEEEKEKLQAQLMQTQKLESVGRLAGGVAHDFNNMLTVILGKSEMAMEDIDPNQALYADLEEIRTAAQRSADVTRQLLAFARKQAIAPKVTNLNKTVESMLKMLHRLIGEDIDLTWLPFEELWLVRIDPSQIDQILANLVVNARDAITGVGKLTIETDNATFDEAYCAFHPGFVPGDFVQLTVSDNGCGMDQETLKNLFEPFYTTKDVDKGTGLGLATVYGIVKQNDGFINVYSELDEGTSFRIYLPRHASVEEGEDTKTQAESASRGNETILLVEDEPSILKMTDQMLDLLGYTVLTAVTPGNAISLAREYDGDIDLLVTDVVMPKMNGRDLAKNLLSIYPNLKCLFMSGYTANVIVHHGVLYDGVNFIQKPFSMQDLSQKVREALDEGKPKS